MWPLSNLSLGIIVEDLIISWSLSVEKKVTTCYVLHWIFQELFSTCNPIVTKPKPKVELPKDDTPAEQNGPLDGQEKSQEEAADAGTTEKTGNASSETTENKPEMDLD